MRLVGFLFHPLHPRPPAAWLLGATLVLGACAKTDDGFDKVRVLPDGGQAGDSGTPTGDGGPPETSEPFITQPDDTSGSALTELPPYDVVGTEWHYSVTTTGGSLAEPQVVGRVQVVMDLFTWPDGRAGARHETTLTIAEQEMAGPAPAYAIEADRILLEQVDGAGGENLPALETVAPLRVGTRFGPRADAAETRVVEMEEVTVPAGTYQAYKLEAQWPTLASKATEWWAEGVGMVRAESTSPGSMADAPFTTVTELESFDQP